MKSSRDAAMARLLQGQGRIMEALADGEGLTATLDRRARRFGLTADELRVCLRELGRAGWVAVQTQPFDRLTVRIERRSLGPRPVARDR